MEREGWVVEQLGKTDGGRARKRERSRRRSSEGWSCVVFQNLGVVSMSLMMIMSMQGEGGGGRLCFPVGHHCVSTHSLPITIVYRL